MSAHHSITTTRRNAPGLNALTSVATKIAKIILVVFLLVAAPLAGPFVPHVAHATQQATSITTTSAEMATTSAIGTVALTPTANSTATVSLAATAPSPTVTTADPGVITATIVGLPVHLTAGGPAIEFTAILSNHTASIARDIAPLFQIVGGACNCVNGSLQRLDATTGAWHDAVMPEGDGYNPLTVAADGVDLAPGASDTFHFRLTISSTQVAEPALSTLYIVALPSHSLVGQTFEQNQIDSSYTPPPTSSSGSSSAPKAINASAIVSLAKDNLGRGACSTNSLGGMGFESSCTGNGGLPEYWCADFAHWVWEQAGVRYSSDLTPRAGSFYLYGKAHGTLSHAPAIGDAVVFNSNDNGLADHVAIVSQVNADGSIEAINGDWNGPRGTEAYFAGHSSVVLANSTTMGMPISWYVAPVGSSVPPNTSTNTPRPTATSTPRPAATNTPRPTATRTNTPRPRPTATSTPRPTATHTSTPHPAPTSTATASPTATPTNTPRPAQTGAITGVGGKCLNVRGGSSTDGTPVQVYTCDGATGQQWTLEPDGTLRALGKCLDVTNNGTANGTPIQLWGCGGTQNQQWVLKNGGFMSLSSGRCLDDPYGSTTDGTQFQIIDCVGGPTQQWALQPNATEISNVTGAITGIGGNCLAVQDDNTSDGTPVQVYPCDGQSGQQWTLASDGTLRALGKCLDVVNGGIANGTPVQLWGCGGTPNQKWVAEDGRFVSLSSGRCLDDPNGSTQAGTRFQIIDCVGGPTQQWSLQPGQTSFSTGVTGVITGVGGKCLDVRGSSNTDGTPVRVYTCDGEAGQQWTLRPDGTLQALGKCLDVTNNGTANGTLIQLWGCAGTQNQQWVVKNGGFMSLSSGRCLDDPYGSTTDGTQFQLIDCVGGPTQQWVLQPGATNIAHVTGVITGVGGKCLDVRGGSTADGTPVQVYTCNGGGGQQWTLASDGTLRSLGKCLDVTNNGTANGTLVQLWGCGGTQNQKWVAEDGRFVSLSSGRCLDDPNGSTTDGTQFQIIDCVGGPTQQWTLQPGATGIVTSTPVPPTTTPMATATAAATNTATPTNTPPATTNWCYGGDFNDGRLRVSPGCGSTNQPMQVQYVSPSTNACHIFDGATSGDATGSYVDGGSPCTYTGPWHTDTLATDGAHSLKIDRYNVGCCYQSTDTYTIYVSKGWWAVYPAGVTSPTPAR